MAMMLQSESSSRSLSSRAPAATADSERASEHPLLQEESVSNPPELTVAAGLPSAVCAPISSQLPRNCLATVGRSILPSSAQLTAHSGRRICHGQRNSTACPEACGSGRFVREAGIETHVPSDHDLIGSSYAP